MEKGIEQGKMQMIRGMHGIGVPLETIAKASKLSVEEIERILKFKVNIYEPIVLMNKRK